MNFLVNFLRGFEKEEMSEIWTKLETQFVERKEPIPKEFKDLKNVFNTLQFILLMR